MLESPTITAISEVDPRFSIPICYPLHKSKCILFAFILIYSNYQSKTAGAPREMHIVVKKFMLQNEEDLLFMNNVCLVKKISFWVIFSLTLYALKYINYSLKLYTIWYIYTIILLHIPYTYYCKCVYVCASIEEASGMKFAQSILTKFFIYFLQVNIEANFNE